MMLAEQAFQNALAEPQQAPRKHFRYAQDTSAEVRNICLKRNDPNQRQRHR